MLEILIGQIPEAIYFSLFMIFAKNLKSKRILYTLLMIAEYLLLKYCLNLQYNIWFQIIYTFMTYVILKVLYKDKAQIIDIFTFMGSLIILLIFTLPFLLLNNIINNIYVCCLISKIFLFIFLYIIKNKIYNINNIFRKLWNRNDEEKRKIKSLTLRNINIVIFNILFYITNILIIYIKTY